jgi:hypothetical protein
VIVEAVVIVFVGELSRFENYQNVKMRVLYLGNNST